MAELAYQKMMLKGLMSLPTSLLRGLSGGGAVYQGGRTLDPRLQFLANAARRNPPMSGFPPEVARAGAAAAFVSVAGSPEPGVTWENLSIDGPGGAIPARAYRADVQDPTAPVLVFAHMGGGVIGDLETCHAFCTILAKSARCPVLSVDYRLAPEHRFPAGLDDVLAAYHWARDNASRLGAPAGHVAIGGDSMGGNFTAIICQELKRAAEPQPVLQMLIYPAVDVASETQSMTTYADAYPLSRATMEWFMGHYLSPGDDPADVRLSPIREKDLSGLAPAVIITAGFDPLNDQGEAYAKRLRDAGVPVAFRCYDNLAHAFVAFTGVVPCAEVACREIAGLVREGYQGRIR